MPLARQRGIEVSPVDWKPQSDDEFLVFGNDLDLTPLIRPRAGWGAFVTFREAKDLAAGFLNPQPEVVEHVRQWATSDPGTASLDAPRRLYLFRTLLQAKQIAAVAHAHPGRTILVVIGEFHKWDIERLLADDPKIRFVQPATLFHPDGVLAERLLTT